NCVRFFRATRGNTAHEEIGNYLLCLFEDIEWQLDAALLQLDQKGRDLAGRGETSVDLLAVARAFDECKEILDDDGLALQALHLGDLRDPAGAICQPCDLYDQIQRRD